MTVLMFERVYYFLLNTVYEKCYKTSQPLLKVDITRKSCHVNHINITRNAKELKFRQVGFL